MDLTAGAVRRDPFAMLPFCGYNMGDYFSHWIDMGTEAESKGNGDKLPKIFFCNWFRKDRNGSFMWPGYGENSRVLAWIFDRCNDKENFIETPIGRLPSPGAIEPPSGVSIEAMDELCSVDIAGWKKEIAEIRQDYYPQYGDTIPRELYGELDEIEKRLNE